MARPKAVMAWSTGKDSAYALHTARQADKFEIVGILTTLTQEYNRVSMHGVREAMLDRHAAALGLPCTKVWIPPACTNEIYEKAMEAAVLPLKAQGVTHFIFGDLYLEDVRAYRLKNLEKVGLQAAFPLWLKPTAELAREMIAAGLRATVTCVDTRKLPAEFAGRTFDAQFLKDLPAGIDPCAENGEFHSCVTAGPMFSAPIAATVGERVTRGDFVFADLIPSA
ncbi:MAG TPA: ATP-binding protein [Planctomycetota bacterium]|nr:ATP-binding protein [Planctomycetota bacterium]